MPNVNDKWNFTLNDTSLPWAKDVLGPSSNSNGTLLLVGANTVGPALNKSMLDRQDDSLQCGSITYDNCGILLRYTMVLKGQETSLIILPHAMRPIADDPTAFVPAIRFTAGDGTTVIFGGSLMPTWVGYDGAIHPFGGQFDGVTTYGYSAIDDLTFSCLTGIREVGGIVQIRTKLVSNDGLLTFDTGWVGNAGCTRDTRLDGNWFFHMAADSFDGTGFIDMTAMSYNYNTLLTTADVTNAFDPAGGGLTVYRAKSYAFVGDSTTEAVVTLLDDTTIHIYNMTGVYSGQTVAIDNASYNGSIKQANIGQATLVTYGSLTP